jgi:hypothetical protein
VHTSGLVDIPFPRSVHDVLLADGLAEEHHWVPDSGWITFHVRKEEDLKRALWLMGLSYLRYALKTASDARGLLERESDQLHLSPRFKSLLEPFVPRTTDDLRESGPRRVSERVYDPSVCDLWNTISSR